MCLYKRKYTVSTENYRYTAKSYFKNSGKSKVMTGNKNNLVVIIRSKI